MRKKLKILEICEFSAGICGVWSRVKQESIELEKNGYEVEIFSSNFIKGSDEITNKQDNLGHIKITRFGAKKLGGESFMAWNFDEEALTFKPDIIIAHGYRHLHTTKALKIAEKLKRKGKKCKVFLVTHAPFAREETRGFLNNLIVWFYDKFIGPKTINKFDKIIAITKWEYPYLLNSGAEKEKIVYIPNGIPEEFFKLKKLAKEENKILFLGRVSPIKNLEVLINAISLIKDENVKLEIVGPAEKNYLIELKNLIKKNKLERRIIFSKPIYDIKRKIKKIDSCKIFVLPSKNEGMPQALIEAMARGKIVIASKTKGSEEIIKSQKNGFLFNSNYEKELARKISWCIDKRNLKTIEEIKKEAIKSVEKLSQSKLINDLINLF